MASSVISYPVPETSETTGSAGGDSADSLNAQGTAQGVPTVTWTIAPPHHPHRGKPIILADGREIAWCDDPRDARLYLEFLGGRPDVVLTALEGLDDYVDDPTRGWSLSGGIR